MNTKRRNFRSKEDRSKAATIHGMSTHKAYTSWNNMMIRCYNEKSKDFKNYGKRGITVDKKWHNFIGFWDDMKIGWKKGLSLDRIDNNLGYFKENCRWTTRTTQAQNRRNSIFIEINGQKRLLVELCRERGLKYKTVHMGIFTYKQDPLKALKII